MNTYFFYLGHEWRQNRAALSFCALFSGGLALWATTFFDAYAVSQSSVAIFGILQAALLYLFAVGSGLLASGERNAPKFFDRLPRGLGAPFAAKASLFFTGLVLAIALGYLALWGSSIWRLGVAPPSPLEIPEFALNAALLVAVAAWTLVASGWVPRAALALPISVLQIGVLAIPYGIVRWLVGPRFQIELVPTLIFLGSIALAALPAALAAYRYTRGGASRPLRGALAALAIGSLFAAPSWAFLAYSRYLPARLDPSDAFVFSEVTFSQDGAQVLVRVNPGRGWDSGYSNLVYSLDEGSGVFEFAGRHVHVTGSGNRRLLDPEQETGFREIRGSRGLRYWLERGASSSVRYFDPSTGIDRSGEEVHGGTPFPPGVWRTWVGKSWVFGPDADSKFWNYDPSTGTRARLPWELGADLSINFYGAMLSDGRLLLHDEGSFFVGDPTSGDLTPLEGSFGDFQTYAFYRYERHGEYLQDLRPLLLGFESGMAVFDGEKLVPGPCLEGHPSAWIVDYRVTDRARHFLWVEKIPTGVVDPYGRSAIWISDADTGERRRLFPPHDPDEESAP